jgi:GT2 family glycosyltransferase
MTKKKLTIIFICYNCGDDIAKNIIEINKLAFENYAVEFIVFDNASADDSLKAIESINISNLKLIANNSNLGFGKACNQGLRNIESDYYLLLNPDIKLSENSIPNLLAFAKEYPDAGIWGGVTLTEQGKADGKNAWREPTLWGFMCWAVFLTRLFPQSRLFSPDDYNGVTWEKVNKVDVITGCFFLINADLWQKLNGFDERFFMYSEEVDLCRRARQLAAQPMITNQATIVHYGGGTTTSENKINCLYKSKLIYFKKYWSYSKYCIARIVFVQAIFLRALLYAVSNKKNERNIWLKLFINQFHWKV